MYDLAIELKVDGELVQVYTLNSLLHRHETGPVELRVNLVTASGYSFLALSAMVSFEQSAQPIKRQLLEVASRNYLAVMTPEAKFILETLLCWGTTFHKSDEAHLLHAALYAIGNYPNVSGSTSFNKKFSFDARAPLTPPYVIL